ncbi:hypothetical protein GCM10010961_23700 [Pseudodonghicola xiamenensis]|uniref:Uncharacterized protein n=1 Tax=Pseudodonghicola xiamenensis TaxID=337702 RepID=A0A8J3H8R2_9RHOB|nr:hypothetical protein GCM10010961_23700 [Pseudodonghicola xiamenensis]
MEKISTICKKDSIKFTQRHAGPPPFSGNDWLPEIVDPRNGFAGAPASIEPCPRAAACRGGPGRIDQPTPH